MPLETKVFANRLTPMNMPHAWMANVIRGIALNTSRLSLLTMFRALLRFRRNGFHGTVHADPGTMDVWIKAIGQERLPHSFGWADMLNDNVKLVYSDDWPACIDINPIRGIHVAVNRRTPEGFGKRLDSRTKISMAQALKAYTSMGAYSSFEEKIKGTIEPGKLADLWCSRRICLRSIQWRHTEQTWWQRSSTERSFITNAGLLFFSRPETNSWSARDRCVPISNSLHRLKIMEAINSGVRSSFFKDARRRCWFFTDSPTTCRTVRALPKCLSRLLRRNVK